MSFPTRYNLGLQEGKRYIEFGGGDRPQVRAGKDVRVDVRPCTAADGSPAVDFVVNMELPFTEEHGQAIASGEFDGAVSIYSLEHVSWRNVPGFLQEVRRVLKDDGSLFLLVPNTQAQMEHLLKTQDWDDAGSMLFGDQNYSDNTHKAAFTPESIDKLLRGAGFVDVAVTPFGLKGTDMIVVARCGGFPTIPVASMPTAPTLMEHPVVMTDKEPAIKSITFGPLGGKPTPTEDQVKEMQDAILKSEHGPAIAAGGQPEYPNPVVHVIKQHQGGWFYTLAKDGRLFAEQTTDDLKYVVEQYEQMISERQEREEQQEVEEARASAPQPHRYARVVTIKDDSEIKHGPIQAFGSIEELNAATSPPLPPDSPHRENVWVSGGSLGEQLFAPPDPGVKEMLSQIPDKPNVWAGGDGLWKSEPSALQLQRHALFGRQYFDGGLPQGGGYQAYWDFPCHNLTAQHVLAKRPESVLELGCGRGYVVKRLQDAGVTACGWDLSRHCHLTRVAESVSYADATDRGRWNLIKDGTFDLCFSIAFLDHVPEELLPVVLENMAHKCRRGLHGVNFDLEGGDSTRATRKTLDWWKAVMPFGHEVVDKAELEAGAMPESFFRGDGKVKLNLGSFATMFHHGWVNVDVHDLRQFAAQNRYEYKVWDVRAGLPWGTESVDLIYHAHMLEHLTYDEGAEYLRECRRVLKPGGAMRVIVPDAGGLIGTYEEGHRADYDLSARRMSELDDLSATVEKGITPAQKLQAVLCDNHKALYDAETLGKMLEEAGFNAAVSSFRYVSRGACRQILTECLDVLPSVSLYYDAVPATL